MFYATHDSDDGCIMQNAGICAFNTEEEARAWLLKAFEKSGWEEEGYKIAIEVGSYSDCWLKAVSAPILDEMWTEPFALKELRIYGPGQHPGGRVYWITPRPDVLVATPRKA